MSTPTFLIYGATGYTGSLIARETVRRGLRPVLAARNAEAVAALAAELGLEHRVFALESPGAIAAGIAGFPAVLNCAGPFGQTAIPLAEACLKSGTHYLDITGEIAVFESLAARDAEARAAGVVLLPGVGFDVVPSDCLAVHLKQRLPTATHLTLAFRSSGRLSRGTALTTISRVSDGGMVRRDGKIVQVKAAWKARRIDFGDGLVKAITIPWGDVATAFYSTGVPNIEVYLAAPFKVRAAARMTRYIGWLLDSSFVQSRLRRRIQAGPPGPTEEERRLNRCYFWAEMRDDQGHCAVARQQTPDGYELTMQAALAAVTRVLAGTVSPGYRTPAMAFGPDFVLELPGVTRTDEVPGPSTLSGNPPA